MTDKPTIDNVPLVLSEGEEPFVMRIGTDERESLEIRGVRYRRAWERCVIDVPYGGDGFGLRASMVADAAGTFVYANAGTFPDELWPLLAQGGADDLPVLTAGATGRAVGMSDGSTTVDVRVLPGGERVPMTTTLVGFGPDLGGTDPLDLARMAAAPVIGAALHVLTEYRTAMRNVPDTAVPTSDGTVPLATLLDLAGQMAGALGWNPRPA